MPERDGAITSRDICNQAVVERILADGSVASIKISANIQSDNFVAGSAGWKIERNTGSAEFNDVTVRGALIAGAGSSIDGVHIVAGTIDTAQIADLAVETAKIDNLAVTDAKIDTLTASKLTAGTIDASVITVNNLDADKINVGILSAVDIHSNNWDGDIPANLSSEDTGATLGFYLDSSVGAAQFEGDVFVGGDILMRGDFATGTTGQARFTIVGGGQTIKWTDDADDISAAIDVTGTAPAIHLTFAVGGTVRMTLKPGFVSVGDPVGANQPSMAVVPSVDSPAFTFTGDADTGMYRVGANSIGFSCGQSPSFTLTSTTVDFHGAVLNNVNEIFADPGAANDASYTFDADEDTGMYRPASNTVGFTAGGTFTVQMTSTVLAGPRTTTGQVVIRTVSVGDAAGPTYTFHNDEDTGMYRHNANAIGFSAGGTRRWQMTEVALRATTTGAYIRSVHAGVSIPTYAFVDDTDTGMYRVGANEIGWATSGEVHMRLARITSGTVSAFRIRDGLTDVGAQSSLLLNVGSGSTTAPVGHNPSWWHTKTDIRPLSDTPWWKREWFMDLETISSRKKRVGVFKGNDPDGNPLRDMRMISFLMDNLIEHTNLLTTKGEEVGETPNVDAILAVTVDYVQHLERRVAALEAAA